MRRTLSIGTHRQVLFGQSNLGGRDDQKIRGERKVLTEFMWRKLRERDNVYDLGR
jgi:hypothetical protein